MWIWIIPARAGFTRTENFLMGMEEDHPRSRGVYCQKKLRKLKTRGSSPLARGLHRAGLPFDVEIRIIPARAGFTYGW